MPGRLGWSAAVSVSGGEGSLVRGRHRVLGHYVCPSPSARRVCQCGAVCALDTGADREAHTSHQRGSGEQIRPASGWTRHPVQNSH